MENGIPTGLPTHNGPPSVKIPPDIETFLSYSIREREGILNKLEIYYPLKIYFIFKIGMCYLLGFGSVYILGYKHRLRSSRLG